MIFSICSLQSKTLKLTFKKVEKKNEKKEFKLFSNGIILFERNKIKLCQTIDRDLRLKRKL